MAAHSNRSPSPLSSRPINPNPRNSESSNIPTIRRSFNGNTPFARPSALTNQRRLDPNTPANSPSDFGRRRSVDREGTAPSHQKACEEKENDENDNVLKASKLQSPAKGCKNFMAPTISAASKFTPSPRKKVLVERNDPVRTSISLSDGKAMFFSDVSQELEPKSEMGHHQNQKDETFSDLESKKAVLDSHPVPKPPCKKVTFSDIPVDSQPSTESVITDSIAPLDADPSLPPYDPKTNYLSPRPQFMRYKPNPRVEMLLNKEKSFDKNEIEDTLMAEMMMSEVFSDSDEATDESQPQDSDMVIGVDEEIVFESELLLPVSTTPVDESCEEGLVEKNEKKPRRRWFRWLSLSVIMILLVCVSVRHAPPSLNFDEMKIKDLSFADLRNMYEQSRVAVDVAVASARLSFGNSVSLVFKIANELLVEGEKRVPLQFMNISDLQVDDDTWKKEAYFLKRVEGDEYEEELGTEMEEEDEFEEEEGAYADGEEVDTEIDTVFEEEEAEFSEGGYDDDFPQDGVVATEETSAEVAEIEVQTEIASIESAAAENQESEVEAAIEEVAMERQETEINLEAASDNGNAAAAAAAAISLEETRAMAESTAEEESSNSISPMHAVAISSSLFAGVVGVAAFIYCLYKTSHHPTSSSTVRIEPVMMSKQAETTSAKMKKAMMEEQERQVSQSCWETESEMSSSYHQIENNEVESSERKTTSRRKYSKRESLASSSGEPSSYSYGSFTTYERIPVNNGYGDEEIVTPVRRSSRIRNLVTSP